ncbi:hypothetical protein IX319_002766 [Bacteroides pyogenes]|nr:hypothetical protein [Bacteroides pyogenes]
MRFAVSALDVVYVGEHLQPVGGAFERGYRVRVVGAEADERVTVGHMVVVEPHDVAGLAEVADGMRPLERAGGREAGQVALEPLRRFVVAFGVIPPDGFHSRSMYRLDTVAHHLPERARPRFAGIHASVYGNENLINSFHNTMIFLIIRLNNLFLTGVRPSPHLFAGRAFPVFRRQI